MAIARCKLLPFLTRTYCCWLCTFVCSCHKNSRTTSKHYLVLGEHSYTSTMKWRIQPSITNENRWSCFDYAGDASDKVSRPDEGYSWKHWRNDPLRPRIEEEAEKGYICTIYCHYTTLPSSLIDVRNTRNRIALSASYRLILALFAHPLRAHIFSVRN